MLTNKPRLDAINPEYKYVGKEQGYDMYVVPIKENTYKRPKINLDDALLDCDDFPSAYYEQNWDGTTEETKKEKMFSQQEFYNMGVPFQMYYVYKQLVDITSLLSDIKEVLKDGN